MCSVIRIWSKDHTVSKRCGCAGLPFDCRLIVDARKTAGQGRAEGPRRGRGGHWLAATLYQAAMTVALAARLSAVSADSQCTCTRTH